MTLIYERSPPVRLHYFSWYVKFIINNIYKLLFFNLYIFRVNGPRRTLTEMGSSARLLVVEEQIPRVKSNNIPPYKSLRSASAEYLKDETTKVPRSANSEMIMQPNFVIE